VSNLGADPMHLQIAEAVRFRYPSWRNDQAQDGREGKREKGRKDVNGVSFHLGLYRTPRESLVSWAR